MTLQGLGRCLLRLALGRRVRQERGQALPLAAIGVLVMALTVLATANLGQAVHERIKLQNTADSAAYSLAAMEARTFNYIAFLNRAQIAHYNTAMVIQSYITWAGFHVALFNVLMELVVNLNSILGYGEDLLCPAKSAYDKWICTFFEIGNLVTLPGAKITGVISALLATTHQAAGMLGHELVKAMQIFNREVMWKAQLWRAAMMNMPLLSGAQALIEVNDPNAQKDDARTLLSTAFNVGLNSWEYYQAFDRGSGVNPMLFSLLVDWPRVTRPGGAFDPASVEKAYEDKKPSKEVEAYQVMAELCNATRFPKFVYNRAGAADGGWFLASIRANKLGQTRFVSQTEKPDESARIDALVLDKGGLLAALGSSELKAGALVDQAKEALWSQAGQKIGNYSNTVDANLALDALNEKPVMQSSGNASALLEQIDPSLRDKPHNHAPGFSLASADVATGGSGMSIFGFVPVSWKGSDKLGDAILAHHKNGMHYGYDAGKVDALFAETTASAANAVTGSELLNDLQHTADSMFKEVGELATLGGDFVDLYKDPVGTIKGAATDAVKDAVTGEGADGMFGKIGEVGKNASDWFGGIGEPAVQAGEKLVTQMKEIAQPIIDKVTGMVNDMAQKVAGKLGIGGLFGSGGSTKLVAIMGILKKILAVLRAFEGKMKNDPHTGTKGLEPLKWPGFAPYFKFNASSDRLRDFNQPSTWIWVSKSHKTFQGKTNSSGKTRSPWRSKFTWTSGWDTAELDTTARGIHWPMMGEGLNAMARGMAYYHRPGNWHEHPNFFNPFWRARLAPIGQKLQSFWERFVGGNLSTSADSVVAQKVLDGLRNAQMDLFTTFVTSMVTH